MEEIPGLFLPLSLQTMHSSGYCDSLQGCFQ